MGNVEAFEMRLTSNKVLRQNDLVRITALSRSTLADIQNPSSPRFDDSFPKKIRLGLRAVGWFEEEIIGWLESRKINGSLEVEK